MILASEIASKYALNANLPFLYRFHPIPIEMDEWEKLPSVTYDRRDAVEMLFRWTRAEMSPYPRPHSSLGLSSYARVSSPARRYPDIVNHRQVRMEGVGEGERKIGRERALEMFNLSTILSFSL